MAVQAGVALHADWVLVVPLFASGAAGLAATGVVASIGQARSFRDRQAEALERYGLSDREKAAFANTLSYILVVKVALISFSGKFSNSKLGLAAHNY